ncbi:hypothetical protein NM208_g9999 [Fusarium decemcellulare]|uniref:Uncharacterized protein n=1 Tax=Fusarium decemcellulare TaxID=57161 RepID=A0ACC1RZG2_9HYPO|nr:hypothetical protein NM208_g9999 [Fusarium decemcellulare]
MLVQAQAQAQAQEFRPQLCGSLGAVCQHLNPTLPSSMLVELFMIRELDVIHAIDSLLASSPTRYPLITVNRVILAPGPSLSAAQPPEIRQASRWDMILDPQSARMQLDASMPSSQWIPLSFPSHTCCDNSQSAIQRLDKVPDLSSKSQLVASAGYGAASFEATSGGSASGLCSTVLQTEPRIFDERGTVNPPCSIQDKEAMHLSIWGRSSRQTSK